MKTSIFTLLFFLLVSIHASAGWMGHVDYSGCPSKFLSGSGTEGPFNSQSECDTRIKQVERDAHLSCAKFYCSNQAGSDSSNNSNSNSALDKGIGDAISAGVGGQISPTDALGLATFGLVGKSLLSPGTEETQEQKQARYEAQVRANQEAARRAEIARQEEEAYQYSQNQNALAFLDNVSSSIKAPANKSPESGDFRGTILCKGGEPGLHTCYVMVCGGAYGGDPICCPEGYPKLNECDCHCYRADVDFECKRYAACQYSFKAKEY